MNQQEKIDQLKSILEALHAGADPDSLQETFERQFDGVSAIEISLMEHQLMSDPTNSITFEDVLKLCNIHARMFKNQLDTATADSIEHPGHPVNIFKQENRALQAALIRVDNILAAMKEVDEVETGMLEGLQRQLSLVGQFDNHYNRKEKVFFPYLEKYGHLAPPKVMWAKDDEIRGLFTEVKKQLKQVRSQGIEPLIAAYDTFKYELTEMIFKEEAILINLLVEALTSEDWQQIAKESYTYGYTIIRPDLSWLEEPAVSPDIAEPQPAVVPVATEGVQTIETQRIPVANGYLTVSYESTSEPVDYDEAMSLTTGSMSWLEIQVLLDHLSVGIRYFSESGDILYHNQPAQDIDSEVWQEANQVPIGEQKITSDFAFYTKSHNSIDASQSGYMQIIQPLDPYQNLPDTVKRDLTPVEQSDQSAQPIYPASIPVEQSDQAEINQLQFSQGELQFNWHPADLNQPVQVSGGQLTRQQVDTLLLAIPIELTFVDSNHIFRYFNHGDQFDTMVFKRTPGQIGRHIEYCHPPKVWGKVSHLLDGLRKGTRDQEIMWYRAGEDKFVYISYTAMHHPNGSYMGIVETVQNIASFIH